MGIESDGFGSNKENEETEDENTLGHEDPLGFVLSSDSDGEKKGLHEDQVSVKQVVNRKVDTKIDCLISAMGSTSHVVEPLEVPSRKELRYVVCRLISHDCVRTRMALRLATVVRRVRSDMVVRLHAHATDCGKYLCYWLRFVRWLKLRVKRCESFFDFIVVDNCCRCKKR